MTTYGKNINLFLLDSTPTGRIKCTLANWTGVVYKIPRTDLEKCKSREDFKNSAVYMLFGISSDTNDPVAYIGQAGMRNIGEGILNRLMEHKRSSAKDYWTDAIVITTSNNSFGQTEISYLENKLYTIAKDVDRCIIKNSNMPTLGNVTEEKESELEEFIEFARIAIGVLGYKILEPYIEKQQEDKPVALESSTDNLRFELLNRNTHAMGVRTSEGFVVLKGSSIKPTISPSCPNNARVSREKYKSVINSASVLEKDVLLHSPAEAACFVTGFSINARNAWKTSNGKTLNEVEAEESRVYIDEVLI